MISNIAGGVGKIDAHVVQKTLKSSGKNEEIPEVETLILVASHLEAIYRELEPPYLEICSNLNRGLPLDSCA